MCSLIFLEFQFKSSKIVAVKVKLGLDHTFPFLKFRNVLFTHEAFFVTSLIHFAPSFNDKNATSFYKN